MAALAADDPFVGLPEIEIADWSYLTQCFLWVSYDVNIDEIAEETHFHCSRLQVLVLWYVYAAWACPRSNHLMEVFGLGVDEIEGEIGIAGTIQFQSGEGGSRSIEAIGADIDTIGIITFLQWLEVGLHFVEGEGARLLEVEVVARLAVGTAPGKELGLSVLNRDADDAGVLAAGQVLEELDVEALAGLLDGAVERDARRVALLAIVDDLSQGKMVVVVLHANLAVNVLGERTPPAVILVSLDLGLCAKGKEYEEQDEVE